MVTSVLIILKHLIYGGTEKYTLNLANKLADKGISVTLVSGGGPLESHVSPKVNLFILPISRKPRIKRITEQKILEIARTCRPQLIHAQCRTSMLNGKLTKETLDIPLVTHEHHMYAQEDYPFIIEEIRDNADKIITIGPYTAGMLARNGLPREMIIPILNGVDVQKIVPITKSERDEARKLLRFSATDKIVVCISRLEPGKGIDKLVKGFISLLDIVPKAKLIIVGDDATGETEQFVKNIVREKKLHDKIFMLPGEFNIRKYHAIADVFCYPALGKGMAVMEAMAAGLPIVGKKTVRKPLVVEHGISGLMTEPSSKYPIDPDQITKKLAYLLKRPALAKQMGRAARKKIAREFTLERVITNVMTTYEEVLTNYIPKATPNTIYKAPLAPLTLSSKSVTVAFE